MTPADADERTPKRPQRVGLEAVALEAGVSVATASRALSGGSVRSPLRDRVESAARRLGYQPDLAAQAVARGTTMTVALIVDYLRSSFGVEITRGVVDAAARHGLVVNVMGAETHPGDLLEMIASARALRPRSLVLATGRVQDPAIRDELVSALNAYQAAGGSVAIVDGLDLPFASCAFDEETAAHALCAELVELGYRRPLVFNSSAERADLDARTRAVLAGFEHHGLQKSAIRLVESSTAVSSQAVDNELIDLGDADIVVCIEGAVLPALYRHIRASGRKVGADVGVTAFGQYGIANALRPHLTTIDLPLRRAGELALEHALTDVAGTHLTLAANVRIRASSPDRRGRQPRAEESLRETSADRTVALVVPDAAHDSPNDLARSLFAIAGENGRPCAILSENSFLTATESSPSAAAQYGAVIVCGPLTPALDDRGRAMRVPCVVVDGDRPAGTARLSVESWEGMQKLLEHLVAMGHTRVVYLAGEADDPAEVQRQRGIHLFSSTHVDVSVAVYNHAAALEGELLDGAIAGGATAIVTVGDLEGARIVRLLQSRGYRVPEDVSVTGFGDSPTSELSTPQLTTVRVDAVAAAASAWRLLDRTDGEIHSLSTTVIPRRSTAPAPPGRRGDG